MRCFSHFDFLFLSQKHTRCPRRARVVTHPPSTPHAPWAEHAPPPLANSRKRLSPIPARQFAPSPSCGRSRRGSLAAREPAAQLGDGLAGQGGGPGRGAADVAARGGGELDARVLGEVGVADGVARDVEEQRLAGDHLELGREADDVVGLLAREGVQRVEQLGHAEVARRVERHPLHGLLRLDDRRTAAQRVGEGLRVGARLGALDLLLELAQRRRALLARRLALGAARAAAAAAAQGLEVAEGVGEPLECAVVQRLRLAPLRGGGVGLAHVEAAEGGDGGGLRAEQRHVRRAVLVALERAHLLVVGLHRLVEPHLVRDKGWGEGWGES
eukprot:scaffold92825_cov66-Phaeocystis_antarctica.AAC.10